MFNAEHLLGSLLTNALGQGLTGRASRLARSDRHGRGLKSMAGNLISQNKGAIGMGLIGLAVGAFEHFTQNQNPQASGYAPSPGSSSPVAPMPQTAGGVPTHPALPWTPPPLPAPSAPAGPRNEEFLLLIRAMIAAANADHFVDDAERQAILGKVTASGLGTEELSFIEQELSNPLDLRSLAAQVKSPEIAEQVYAASLLALEVDSDAERNYLQRLAAALKLDAATVAKWSA
jgi:uncharacterized membrane protein YebE (DUF533 family)